MCISESVLIALITFASGFFGALLGLVGVVISSKYSASAQMKQIVIQEYFKKRSEAFTRYLTAIDNLAHNPFLDENIFAYTEAEQAAILVASPATAEKIHTFSSISQSAHTEEERENAFSSMVSALQLDLIKYTEPSVKKASSTRRKPRR